jgi:large repetitive protein
MVVRRSRERTAATAAATLLVTILLGAVALTVGPIASGPPAVAAEAPVTITVDTTVDGFDGGCGDGDCSLRDAVASAPEGAIVLLPPGVYPLTLTGEGGVGVGDVNLPSSVTVAGAGGTGAFVDASGLDRWAFSVKRPGVSAVLRDVTIFGARDASLRAGGVWVEAGTLTLDQVSIAGGRAARGGGASVGLDGTLRVRRSLFLDDRAGVRGGALAIAGAATIEDSAVVGSRGVDGGGVWVGPHAEVAIRTSTLAGNAASGGGAVWAAGRLALRSVTLAGNDADVGGGILSTRGSEVTAGHTIVALNTASAGAQCRRPLQSRGHNLESDTGCGFHAATDRRNVDPRLGPLTSNGGGTPTRALRADSPALDVGGDCDPRDQRGAPRAGPCDAGAYERVLCLGRPVTIVGSTGDDELAGGLADDVFLGQGGEDEFQWSLGADRLCGGAGDDPLLLGGPGDDLIAGGSGDDRLVGEEGKDLLDGGRGIDVCRGGPGTADRVKRCEAGGGVPRPPDQPR